VTKKTKTVGTVSSNPVIAKIKGGVLVGNVYVDIEGVGRAKVFYDDPESPVMFSFQKGDEVKVEWWKRGEWINANILTPSGSVEDPEEEIERARNKIEGGSVSGEGNILNDYAAIIVMCREAVIDAGIEQTIDEDASSDAVEETIRTASMGLFIELNRSGVDYEQLLE
jgi:hypothetical protein